MSITTLFNKDHWEQTTLQILYEWLTTASCFGSGSTASASVKLFTQSSRNKLTLPQVEVSIISTPINESTGAGRGGNESVFRRVVVEILIKTDREGGKSGREQEFSLVQLCDTLDKYFRSTSGAPVLGAAELKRAELVGPTPIWDEHYYMRNFFLSFRIMVG